MSKIWKKLLAVALTASISAGAAIAGTVAYLQDTESDVNVMTLGNVSITQNEYQRVEENGEFSAKVEPFQQGKPMYPVTNREGENDELTIGGHTIVRMDSWNNYIDKMVTVKNTGKSDAYVRTLVAMPSGGSEWESGYGITDYGKKWLGLTTHKVTHDTWFWHMQNSEPDALGNTPVVAADAYKPVLAEINGKNYYVWEFTYKTAIEPGYETYPNLQGVRMHSKVDADDAGYYMDENSNGKYDTGDKRIEGVTVGGAVDVLVLSQAVQTAGFADPQTALDTAFGDVDAAKAAEWFGALTPVSAVSTADELEAALAAGGSVVLTKDIVLDEALSVDKLVTLDLGNKTLTSEGLEFKDEATIKNGKIVSGDNTNMVPHLKFTGDAKMENVDVEVTHYLNYQAQGNRAYGEYTGLEVAGGTLVLDNCDISVKNDTYRTWSYVYGITMNNASVTMNGGSITVESVGASITDLQTALSGIGNSTATMNNVAVSAVTLGTTMGHLIVNTTDSTVTDADFVSYGGTFDLNIK